MDTKSLELLEFPRVRELIAEYTAFSPGHELALNIQPLTDRARISLLLEQSAEARRLLDEDTAFDIGDISDIRESVRLTALGKVLEPLELLDVQQALSTGRRIRRGINRHAIDFPRLWGIAGNIIEIHEIEKEISRCLTPAGEILDSASAQLSSIRHRLKKVKEQLYSRLEATLKSAKGRRIVQEPIITERDGRYVIPIKVENRKDIKGIVHDVSNTGATIFIEPWATLDMGNELRQLTSEERYEIERILRDISLKLAVRQEEIIRNIDIIAELDLILAKAKYARRTGAVEPVLGEVNDGIGTLKLVNARHPLLGDKAVPLSVELGNEFSILVITGPNMGGKTVALKTVGLLSAMALSGLPVPASDESRIPVFDGIFADIGDEQSIEQTVSTFSWHMGNIVRIIRGSSSKSLVLLDELGASTDPAEGSALARSLLLYLLSRKTMAVATSHYDELKAFAHFTKGLQNASLDLDPETKMPTYHLTVGIPGGSNALAVAEHLGLPLEIINSAREMMGKGTQELERLLTDLNAERGRLTLLRRGLEEQRKDILKRNTELEKMADEVRIQERRLVEETRDIIVREAASLQRDIRQATADLRKVKSKEDIEKAKTALANVQRQLKKELWQPAVEEVRPVEDEIKPGDAVLVRDANVRGTVLSILQSTGQVEVQAGRARLTISISGLEKVQVTESVKKSMVTPITKQVSRPVSMQLDLRGKRADEIEPELDSYINSASVSGLKEVRIVHGMATGTVRKIVREFLSSHPLVRSYRPGERGEGGDGATVVKL
jgi:DNA mismatch repair protein MutS2